MTPSEQERAFIRARNAVVRERATLMRNTRDDIVRMLQEALVAIKSILAGQPTEYQQWSLGRLAREIQQVLADYGVRASGAISAAAGKSWELGERLVEEPLAEAGIEVRGALQAVSRDQLEAMRTFMVDRIKNIGVEAANKVNVELGLVVMGGQTPSSAVTHITTILSEKSRKRATTIVRTELGRVFAVAAHRKMLADAGPVPGLKKQWRHSRKMEHPRPLHVLADGQVKPVDEPFLVGGYEMMFPHDPSAPPSETINCGCISLPFKDDWKVTNPGRLPLPPDFGEESLQDVLARAARAPKTPA